MWISDSAIERPVTTIAVMLALVVFGIAALFVLEVNEFPQIEPPVVSVSVPYPGASPQTVEREVVEPIENAIASISGVDRIRSTSLYGYGIIITEFDYDKDLDRATQEIRDQIAALRRELPSEMEEPVISQFDFESFPIVSLTLASDRLSRAALTQFADPAITSAFESITGVAQVQVRGGVEPVLRVNLHPNALEATDVTVAAVVQSLRAANLAAPVGRVTGRLRERAIRLEGRLERPSAFGDIVVARSGGELVRLEQVASVFAGSEEPRSLAFFNGEPAIGIDIVKSLGASTTAVAERVLERVDEIRATLPEGVRLEVVRNAGESVEESVASVEETLILGALLTIFVVFLFLNSWRSTVITGLALPVSVLASFIAVWALGYTLNTMTLLGLSLAIGLLIDDAIVVRENIVRHMERGEDELTAARTGTAEIGPAVAAITLSIMVVFIPIAFMGGVAEQWMGPMAITIAAAVLVSLFVSFSLDPMLSAHWSDPELTEGDKSWLSRKLAGFNRWLDGHTSDYRRLIAWALRHRIAMVAIAVGSFVVALALPAMGLIGSSFFPDVDTSEFNVALEVPPGSSLDYTRIKTTAAGATARDIPGVAYTYATIGGQGGTVTEASIFVNLVPKDERELGQDEIANLVRTRVDRLAGVEAAIAAGGPGGARKAIQIQLHGPDIEVLSQLAAEVMERVEHVPGAVDVGLSTRGRRPEFEVDIDRDLAASLGLSVGRVAQALRPAFAGIDVGDWVDPTGETRDVRVRYAPESRARRADVVSLPLLVPGPGGEAVVVPLGQIADIRRGRGPARIQHLDRERVIAVQANTRGRPLSAVVAGIRQQLEGLNLPPGYELSQGGNVEAQREVFGRILAALGIALLLMYLVLVIQFGSFLDPLPIMFSLPLSLIGVMLALLVTGTTLNLMSLIGVVLLMGIVAKNAILLIDFAKWSQDEGMGLEESIIEAGGVRLRPILMTSVAIIAGMLPVAIGIGEGSGFRAPLGIAVIGGVITSTLLTLLVIPTFYDILAGWRERVMRRFGGHGGSERREEARERVIGAPPQPQPTGAD